MSDALVAAFWFLVALISGLAEGLAMALTLAHGNGATLKLSHSRFCQQRSWANIDGEVLWPLQQTNMEKVICA